jgi:4'-phosphopantetheinyl transferase
MPLHLVRKVNDNAYLGLWQLQESPDQLFSALSILAPALPVPVFENTKRKREWLASRILAYTLLQKFTPAYHLLEYDSYGKPGFVSSPCQVSISHSGDWAAVLLSSKERVGIDLEHINLRIVALASRFLSEEEQQVAEKDPEKLSLFWSSKETLYKLYGRKRLIFKENLQILSNPQAEAGILLAQVITPSVRKTYQVFYEKLKDYILTYCLSDSA